MTEPNEPPTPLARMRFSWQRGTGRPTRIEPRPPDVPHVDDSTPPADAVESKAGDRGRDDTLVARGWVPPVPARTPEVTPEAAPPASTTPRAAPEVAAPEVGAPELPPPASTPATPYAVSAPATRREEVVRREAVGVARGRRRSAGTSRTRQTFDVPPPGGRFSGGRGAHAAVRVTLVLCSCLVATGIVAYFAFTFGLATARSQQPSLDAADIARYRLTAFPVAQAGQFAADYARICLTHDTEPGASEEREALLARYVSSGVDPTCGWNGEGGSQQVIDATWTGESEPIEEYGEKARMMTVRVLTDKGSRIVTVPVYVADLRTGDGMRVVGDIGEVPQPTLVEVPPPEPRADVDGNLTDGLVRGEFFAQFFTAWGDSDAPALQRLMTPDATRRVANGLGGSLTSPTIRQARVFLPPNVDSSAGTYEWRTGEHTEAWVWVDWHMPGVGETAVETRAYRLQLVKTTEASSPSQEWAVRDIRGGVPAVKGG